MCYTNPIAEDVWSRGMRAGETSQACMLPSVADGKGDVQVLIRVAAPSSSPRSRSAT